MFNENAGSGVHLNISLFHPACEIIVENKGKTDLNHTAEEQETPVVPLIDAVFAEEVFFFCPVQLKMAK